MFYLLQTHFLNLTMQRCILNTSTSCFAPSPKRAEHSVKFYNETNKCAKVENAYNLVHFCKHNYIHIVASRKKDNMVRLHAEKIRNNATEQKSLRVPGSTGDRVIWRGKRTLDVKCLQRLLTFLQKGLGQLKFNLLFTKFSNTSLIQC